MGLRHAGYVLDVAILALVGYLYSSSPLAVDVAKHGLWGSLQTLADGAPYTTPAGQAVALGDATQQKWFDFVFGNNLGRLATADPECATFHELDVWLNELVLPRALSRSLPHMFAVWARNLLAGWALYYVCGFLWAFVLYVAGRSYFFPGDKAKEIPTWEDMKLQISVSTNAMVLYSLMPTWGEWFIERGLTKAYLAWPELTAPGLGAYLGGLALYIFLVEWGIFWVHYSLHWKPIYWLHKPHHIYNNNLSPFAGLAFHPVDGMCQASPYLLFLFAAPVHFWTHLGMLFFTGIWTTNIHDTITVDTEPVMGAGYHTLHHSLYKDNYGQFFVFFDWIHETLTPPKHRREQWNWDARHKGSKAVKSE